MKINFFSITFWFNIFNEHNDILEEFQEALKDEYDKFNVFGISDNYVKPVISAINNKKKTNLSFSQINLQYNMDNVSLDNFDEFKEKSLQLLELLNNCDIEVLHTAIFINGELVDENALEKISKHTISSSLYDDNLIDMTLKLGKKHEDLFYKIVTILNKKQIKLPQKADSQGRMIPIPLISWNGSLIENELIDISYEINDKYLFDFTKDYHTTEFYLNKMLYILSENFTEDINNIIDKGIF